jgi:hypothetical protein
VFRFFSPISTELTDLAKDFLGTFSVEFVEAYGVEYCRSKLAEIDKETFKEEKAKRELTYREVWNYNVLTRTLVWEGRIERDERIKGERVRQIVRLYI